MQNGLPTITWTRFLIGAGFVLSIAFTFLMPQFSETLSGIRLFLFWTLHIFIALFILQCVQILLMNFNLFANQSPWVQIITAGFIGSVIFAPIAGLLDFTFGVSEVTDDVDENLLELMLSELTGLVGIVMIVWIGLNASRLLQIQTPQSNAFKTAPSKASFWDRVPESLGRDLVALSAELHYLRVYTVKGDTLVLYSFGQAIKDIKGAIDGQQIHRSHWVSFEHIQSVDRKGQGGLSRLSNGVELPVSRHRKKDLLNTIKKRT